MINSKKKGFTIVELVIVIAVVAILAAVLIPTFSNLVKKANVSNDTALVKNLNTALAADVDGQDTMYDALQAAKEFGYDIAKIQAKANGNKILWDSKNDCFVYLNDGQKQYIPDSKKESAADSDLWIISNVVDETYSTYLYGYEETEVAAKFGLDTGECVIEKVYANGLEGEFIIRTTGGTLEIDSPKATINHYGSAQEVYVINVYSSTYNLFGNAGYIEVADGKHVVLKQGSSVTAVYAPNANVEVENGQNDAVHTEGDKEDIKASATKFAGGLGTKEKPYLIVNAEHMQNITTLYDSYNYYEVANGVNVIDLTDYSGQVYLNGSFDGNKVLFTNVNSYIFRQVGTGNKEDKNVATLANFDVVFEGGYGVVRNCGATTLEFKNINASGYLLCDWNAGVFLRYGTRNISESGFDYTVNFVNCSAKTEVYSTDNSYSAILVGHPYAGNGKLTLNVDSNTDKNINDAVLYFTGSGEPFGNKYYCANESINLNVEGVSNPINKITGSKIIKIDSTKIPSKNDNGSYTITPEGDTATIVISLRWQYTLYTENYAEKIEDQSGVGGQLGERKIIEIKNAKNISVLDSFKNIEIVTGASKFDYEIIDGKLIIYMQTTNQYVDGTLTLNVEQFTSSAKIAKYKGSIVIATNEKGIWK